MRLLFLNALKGLKRKAIQMIGLIVLIMTSTGIFTMMNSSLDRMDSMSYGYIEEQKIEHASFLLNNNYLLRRETYDNLFTELNEEAYAIVTSEEFTKFKDITEVRGAALQQIIPGFTNDSINRVQIKILNEYREEHNLSKKDQLTKEDKQEIDKRIVNYFNSAAYMLQIITDKKYEVKDVDVYLFFASQSRVDNLSIYSDPNSVWHYFMPTNPGDDTPTADDAMNGSASGELPPVVTKLYDRYNALMRDVDINSQFEKDVLELETKYNLSAEYRAIKDVTFERYEGDKSTVIAVTEYKENVKVNKPYLIEGRFPTEDNEITLSINYMDKNNLKIGDKYKIREDEYTICGSAYIPDYIYPAISLNTPVYDEAYHTVSYVTKNTYEHINGIENAMYNVRFNDYKDPYGAKKDGEFLLDAYFNELANDEAIWFSLPSYKAHPRIAMFLMEQKNNRIMTHYLMIVLLVISIVIIVMVMKKKIDDERRQIGVLKSLGYSTVPIAISYLVYPIVGSIVGGTLGYWLGISFQEFVVSMYKAYFNIPIDGFNFSFIYWILSVAIPLVSLTILSFIVAVFMLRHRPLKLLNEGSNLKVNLTTKCVTKLTSKLPFKYRFKYSLASRSLGKLFSITFSSFATGLLIVMVLIGSTMMTDFIDESFAGVTYEYTVDFQSMQDTAKDGINHSKEDVILSQDLDIKAIIKNGERDETHKNKQLKCFAINGSPKTFKIEDAKGRDLSSKIKSNTIPNIIISDPVRVLYKLNVGDQIVLNKKIKTSSGSKYGKEIIFNVVGLKDTFNGFDSYVNKDILSEYLGYENTVYNTVWTNELHESYKLGVNGNVRNVFSVNDLGANLATMMDMMNISIYLVITFAGIMALIIISVVSSIVIEENKRHISLMKVMGYKDKTINSVVLNIYTPFVIIAYFLSIPSMIWILQSIIGLVAKNLDFTIPIKLGLGNALIGLGVILLIYFIALYTSRRALNRIPLSEALKRE